MNTNLAVRTKNLFKSFDGKEVIHDCTMSVEKGTIYGFWERMEPAKQPYLKYSWDC